MRLAAAFAKKPVLMPFIMAGDPSVEATERIVAALAEAGADLIELGVPLQIPWQMGRLIRQLQRGLWQGAQLCGGSSKWWQS